MNPTRLHIPEGFRPATRREILSRSFGEIHSPRNPQASSWEQRRGTLEDQAIFGPLQDYQCACGKYAHTSHEGMICDRCGAKVTVRHVRRQRFGHIALPAPIVHPFGTNEEYLETFPVLPAAWWESAAGQHLVPIYDELVVASASSSLSTVAEKINQILELLQPVHTMCQRWDLQASEIVAWGMALEAKATYSQEICENCGYLLAGLNVTHCPGCQSERR